VDISFEDPSKLFPNTELSLIRIKLIRIVFKNPSIGWFKDG
jgi:hypothetical protein